MTTTCLQIDLYLLPLMFVVYGLQCKSQVRFHEALADPGAFQI